MGETGGFPAITLWQPWASLVACGAKTWETRGWPTKYRGPLRIHAAQRRPRPSEVRPFGHALSMSWCSIGQACAPCTPVCGDCTVTATRALPLGRIVATANLVDCCPIGDPYSFRTGIHEGDEGDYPGQGVVVVHPPLHGEDLWTLTHDDADTVVHDITDQLPFGEWEPGRWAWRLEDIAPTTDRCPECLGDVAFSGIPGCPTCNGDGGCPPVPAKGGQRLWRWRP